MAEGRESFPRQYARTRRFTLGRPRSFLVAKDGSRVVFLRTSSGSDPSTCLWVLDVDAGAERLVVDPRALAVAGEEELPAEERARRERAREMAGGVVGYGADPLARVAAFALSGRLFAADLVGGEVREVPAAGPVLDPRPDPTGTRLAYVTGGALHAVELSGGPDRVLAAEDDPEVTWGLAEFVAQEEMGRARGYWWAPDGGSVLAARADVRAVARWHIADPAEPERPPQAVAYPAAGTANAEVTVAVLGLDGTRVDVDWDREAFPYLVAVDWPDGHPPSLLVQSRDQRRVVVLEADPATGRTRPLHETTDPAWVEIVPGVPARTWGGRLVHVEDRDGTRTLLVDGEPATPPGLQVRRVVHAGGRVLVSGSEADPTEVHLWEVAAPGEVRRLTSEPGVHDAEAGGDVVVVTSASLEEPGARTVVLRSGRVVARIASHAERPVVEPRVRLLSLGTRELRSALLLPSGPHPEPLPVLVDPYGGPHAQRVLKARDAFLQSQWFADQGFAVLVTDGRGTPGRGPAWEKAVHLDLAGPVLEDQVEALHAAARAYPQLDLSRVAIRGWSFGGYLAALAVLRRPDVFHAAVAGAPVTDWRLYDTHYTERYLGHPDRHPEAYERSSLLADAARLERPLLLIHGLADDNVVVAHTLRLSRALLEAGRPHAVLPLSGTTHLTRQEAVAENLLQLQVAFLRQALAL